MRLLLLAFLLLAPLAAAQEQPPANETPAEATPTPAAPEPLEIFMEATDQGGFAFFIVGNPQKNPTLTFAPGQQVTIHLRSTGGFHNIQVEGQKASDYVDTGEETTYTFTAPATGATLKYWCVPHKGTGMIGNVQIGTAPATGGGDAGDIAGGEVSGDTIEVPGCPGSKVPAAIGEGVAGAPTMEDYQAKCQGATAGFEPTEDPYKRADYILPVSFGLIGVGVLAVVWVHKSYKP